MLAPVAVPVPEEDELEPLLLEVDEPLPELLVEEDPD